MKKSIIKKTVVLLIFLVWLISGIVPLENAMTEQNIKPMLPESSWAIDWDSNGVIIMNNLDEQTLFDTCSDGNDGCIIAWGDPRDLDYDIYAQKIDRNGNKQWGSGIEICGATGDQHLPVLCSDGAGGAIIAWEDARGANDDIYIQRVTSDGTPLWGDNGTLLSNAEEDQIYPNICSDGLGGAIVGWRDYRNGTNASIYAQRINQNGIVQWTPNGTVISNHPNSENYMAIASDENHGAIIAWIRYGVGWDIHAQKIDSSGVKQWTSLGIPIAVEAEDQDDLVVVGTSSGGAYIAWEDDRVGIDDDIYAQYVNPSGVIQWTLNGIPICTASESQGDLKGINDGNDAMILSWTDYRNFEVDVFAQKVNILGQIQWQVNGNPVIYANSEIQGRGDLCSDGAGGAIITWQDQRGPEQNIYCQRVNATGSIKWDSDGYKVYYGDADTRGPRIVSDSEGGSIMVWYHYESTLDYGYRAQRVFNGKPYSNNPANQSITTNRNTIINWTLSDDCSGGQYRVVRDTPEVNDEIVVDWTDWDNGVNLPISVNVQGAGEYNYTIEYYDDQNVYGIPNSVLLDVSPESVSPLISGYPLMTLFLVIVSISAFLLIKTRRK